MFNIAGAELFIPDGAPAEDALARTTHLAISAHQDDIEMMAAQPILECFHRKELWFTGVVMSNGCGSPRAGHYEDYSDEDISRVRMQEQRKASVIGNYAAQVMLSYPSETLKDGKRIEPVLDLVQILRLSKPVFVYTHNLADKHDTHVAVALRVIAAIRALSENERPQRLFGCEVWRSLDWMPDDEIVKMDLPGHENLQAALLGVFDSQISGGKRYDLASLGRRRANATFSEARNADTTSGLSYAMDMSPLIEDDESDPSQFVSRFIERFSKDVLQRVRRFS